MPTTHLGGFYKGLAGTCGLWPHPSGTSWVGDARWSLAMLTFDPRVRPRDARPWCKGVNPCYAWIWPKSVSLLSLPMMQGWSLATLTFAPRARPHNAYSQCKGEPSLHSASIQESILTISAHDARSKSRYAPLWPKGKASQSSSLI